MSEMTNDNVATDDDSDDIVEPDDVGDVELDDPASIPADEGDVGE